MANLVIVESPTKAKTIKKILGKGYEVTASMGHLRDLPHSSFGVDVDKDFTPHYINIEGKSELIKKLKDSAKNADRVYLATDPDREGEAISWHLAQLLGIDPATDCRIEVHEITPTAIKTAITEPRPIDISKFKAQEARRIIDRIVGYELSPLLWQKVMRGLSAGRVQSVAVKIIADREKQINDFVPEEYWTLSAKFQEPEKNTTFIARLVKENGEKLEIKNGEMAHHLEEKLKNADYIVKDASVKPRRRHAVPPFTTSTLQQEANKQLNFNSCRTMSVAQELFEGISLGEDAVGLITYMRTDSVRIAGVALNEIRKYIESSFGNRYLPEKPNFYAAKKNAQDAHEAIRPTSIFNTPEKIRQYLTKDQYALYNLIWKRAVASQMADAEYEQTQIEIEAGTLGLLASGSELKFDGYRKVSGKDFEEEKIEIVPFVPAGTKLNLQQLLPAEQHFTEPPAHYTEASLINKLEAEGIGRPSTYAPTIQTIISRNYVERASKKLLITDLGMQVNDLLTKYFPNLIDLPFSANMEDDLDKIAEGKKERNDVIGEFYTPFNNDIKSAKAEIEKIKPQEEVTDIKCELCGRNMVIKTGRYGKFLACPGYPDCKNAKPLIVKVEGVSCPKCGGEILERKTKRGKVFYGCSNYPKCDFSSWEKPINKKCNICGSIMVEKFDRNKNKVEKCSNPECANGIKRRVRSVKVKTKK